VNYHNNLRIFFEKKLIFFSDFDVATDFFFHLIAFLILLASSFLHEKPEELLVLIKE